MSARLVALLPPVFFAAAPVLMLAANNHDQVLWDVVLPPLLLSMLGGLLLFGLGWLVLRDAYKASLLTALAMVAFYSYGHLHTALSALEVFPKTRYVHYLLMPIFLAGLLGGTWWLAHPP